MCASKKGKKDSLSRFKAAHGSGEANLARTRKATQLRRRVLLKMIESGHMLIGKELEANFGDAVGLYDYWIVLKLSGNERSGNETNIAEKIVLEYAHFPHTLPQAVVLLEPERGEPPRPFIDSHCPRSHQSFPTHSRRLATLVAQPVAITLPLGSKISRATVSVNVSPTILTSMARVSLCVCIQTPAGLKTKT